MSILKNVVIAGGASTLGTYVLKALQNHPAKFNISALKRPNSSTTFPSDITTIETDFSPLSLLSAFKNQDAVVSVLGFAGIAEQINMIDAAEEAGVKRFIPSEFGWSRDLPMLLELKARLEPKEKSFEYLVKKCEGSEMTWSAVASGVFIEWCLQKVPTLGFSLANHTATIYDSGNEPFSATTGAAVGKSVTNILINPTITADRFLKTSSFKTTQNAMLAALEELTRSKWEVSNMSVKEVVEQRKGLLAQEPKIFPKIMMTIIAQQLFEDGAGRGVTVEVKESDNELSGVKEEVLLEVLERFL